MMFDIAVIDVATHGSTGKIATNICQAFSKKGLSACFCYGTGTKPDVEHSYRICSVVGRWIHALMCRITGYQGFFSVISTIRLISFLKRNSVKKIFALQLHGYYLNEPLFFRYISSHNIKFVYIMIDEYPLYGKCGYRGRCDHYLMECAKCPNIKEYPASWIWDRAHAMYKQKKEAYNRLVNACFVGPEYLIEQARKSPLTKNVNLKILDEAIDTDFFYPRNTKDLRNKLGIEASKIVIVCIAPYWKGYERKGVPYFIELAKKMELYEKFVFVHVGYMADQEGLPGNYIAKGFINDQNELAVYYSLGDLFVFPSIQDTMPNACLEALSCGTPLLCFDTSGMPYLGDETVLKLVGIGDVDAMACYVESISRKSNATITTCREYAIQRYSSKLYSDKLLEIMSSI